MRTIKSTVCVPTIILLLAGVAWSADIDKSFNLPMLTVSADGGGEYRRVEFSLVRKAARQAPLAIAISESTPGGAGESLRASVWMAAMVTALDRLDDLSGVRISLDLDESVDGPSAGGVLCLAMMTALDGREFPADCAMTGTIMPDGTIGSVGAVAAKMRAAAKAGAKRLIVPAFLRFENDPKSGDEIDLRRLAVELKLKLVPADNIAQAFSAAHDVQRPAQAKADHDVLDLPEATEELLKKRYSIDLAAGAKAWEAIPEDERKLIAAEPLIKRLLIDQRNQAENAYRAGRLLYANTKMAEWKLGLTARQENTELMTKLAQGDVADLAKQMDEALEKLTKEVPTASGLIKASRGQIRESGIQLCAEYCEMHALEGVTWLMRNGHDSILSELAKEENKAEAKQAELSQSAINLKVVHLWMTHMVIAGSKDMVKENGELAATLGTRKPTGNSAAVERLFYSAFLAANNSFQKDVVATAARGLKVTQDEALGAMMAHDISLAMYMPAANAVTALHNEIAPRGGMPEDSFATAASAHIDANSLAVVSGIITRWSILEPEITDASELRYGRTDLLNHLLTSARDNALLNIAECRKRGIPCIQPIAYFESAELGRDDEDEDKVTVLASYWNSSLQAKVLLMLFSSNAAK